MLVLIDKVAYFSLTQREYFTGWENYAVLSNQSISPTSLIPLMDSETNDWNRFASFEYRYIIQNLKKKKIYKQ